MYVLKLRRTGRLMDYVGQEGDVMKKLLLSVLMVGLLSGLQVNGDNADEKKDLVKGRFDFYSRRAKSVEDIEKAFSFTEDWIDDLDVRFGRQKELKNFLKKEYRKKIFSLKKAEIERFANFVMPRANNLEKLSEYLNIVLEKIKKDSKLTKKQKSELAEIAAKEFTRRLRILKEKQEAELAQKMILDEGVEFIMEIEGEMENNKGKPSDGGMLEESEMTESEIDALIEKEKADIQRLEKEIKEFDQ